MRFQNFFLHFLTFKITFSTFPTSGAGGRAHRNVRRSSNAGELQTREHCAVERTVTQITYCAGEDQDNSTNRDSGMVESG